MSEKTGLKDNLLSGATWMRALYMLLFVLIYGIAEILVAAVAILQLLFVLVTGDRNEQLLRFGGSLSTFVYQVILFWTFKVDEKPFPFTDWPASE